MSNTGITAFPLVLHISSTSGYLQYPEVELQGTEAPLKVLVDHHEQVLSTDQLKLLTSSLQKSAWRCCQAGPGRGNGCRGSRGVCVCRRLAPQASVEIFCSIFLLIPGHHTLASSSLLPCITPWCPSCARSTMTSCKLSDPGYSLMSWMKSILPENDAPGVHQLLKDPAEWRHVGVLGEAPTWYANDRLSRCACGITLSGRLHCLKVHRIWKVIGDKHADAAFIFALHTQVLTAHTAVNF